LSENLVYDLATEDALTELHVLYEKAWAASVCMMDEFFDRVLTEDETEPGLSREMLFHSFPFVQQLAFITTDYLFDMGKAIKAMRKDCTIIRPEPPTA